MTLKSAMAFIASLWATKRKQQDDDLVRKFEAWRSNKLFVVESSSNC